MIERAAHHVENTLGCNFVFDGDDERAGVRTVRKWGCTTQRKEARLLQLWGILTAQATMVQSA